MKNSTKDNIKYFPVFVLLHALALLPLRILYIFSDIIFFLLYYIFRYRLKVVRKNIRESFPDKSTEEQSGIIKGFYKHFADYCVETIKILHISDSNAKKLMQFENIEAIDELLDKGRSMIVYAGHYGNWEYLSSVTLWSRHNYEDIIFGQIYRPLKNKWFDSFFLKLRSRFNSSSFAKKSAFKDLILIKRSKKPCVIGFISDQHPSGNDTNHVIRFLNHDTAFITGSEVIARKLDFDVLYFDIEKISRGHYKTTIKIISTEPDSEAPMSITDTYAKMLETSILKNPTLWLWSHKRWKHKCTVQSKPIEP